MLRSKLFIVIILMFCVSLISSAFAGCGKNDSSSGSSGSVSSGGILIDFDESGPQGEAGQENNQSGVNSTGSKSGDKSTGNTSSGNKNEANSNSSVSQSSDPFKEVPEKLKGTSIKFAHWGDEGASEYQKVIKAFTKKTKIDVDLVSYNQEEYVSTLSKQIAAKNGPDLIICNGTFPAIIEITQALNSYFNRGAVDLRNSFWDAEITKEFTLSGKTYFTNSLKSVWQNIAMVFYNKAIFANNGITSPLDYYEAGKWTYENMRKCMEDVKKLGLTGGFADPQHLATQSGQPLIKYDPVSGKFTNNLMSAVSSYQFTAQNLKDGLWNTTSWWGTFQNGEIGIYVSGLYGAKYNGYFKDMDNNQIAIVPQPSSWEGKALKPSDGPRGYGIAKGAKNPEAVSWFLRYFLDYDYYESAGAGVFKNTSLKNMYFNKIVPEVKAKGRNFNHAIGVLQYASSNPATLTSDVGDNVGQVNTVLGTVNNNYKDAADKANAALSKYR